jgi:hypothetical protein
MIFIGADSPAGGHRPTNSFRPGRLRQTLGWSRDRTPTTGLTDCSSPALPFRAAGLIVVNPVAPTLPNAQHRAVQLTAGEQDLTQVLATAQDNLTTLQRAFSDVNAWELETLDHTLKPFLSPLLDETSGGAANYSIPVELSQIQTNVLETFGNYNELKAGAESVLSPEISAIFALTKDVDAIGTEFAAGDTAQGMSDLNNLSSDVLGAFVNGYDFGTNPFNGAEELFPGLLNDGSLLQSLLVTWPEQLVTALGESSSTTAAESVSTALPDLFSGLVSF